VIRVPVGFFTIMESPGGPKLDCAREIGSMKRRLGIYRFTFLGGVECARTHASAGDASPFLDRDTYEALSFDPPFETLPTRDQYMHADRTARYPIRLCDLVWQ
jgi:hypothetical protein